MAEYEQSRLWEEASSPTPTRLPRRAASRRERVEATAPPPLFSLDAPPRPPTPAATPPKRSLRTTPGPAPPMPTDPAPAGADDPAAADPAPATVDDGAPTTIAGAGPERTGRQPAGTAVDTTVAPGSGLRPPPRPLAPAGSPVRAVPKLGSARPTRATAGPAGQAAPHDDEAMAAAADWVEGLIEEVGKQGPTLRAFVRAFPPEPRWGDPWTADRSEASEPPPFVPSAISYAAALREVVAGRRRLRLDGRWDDGRPGVVVAVARSTPGQDAPSWEIAETLGLEGGPA